MLVMFSGRFNNSSMVVLALDTIYRSARSMDLSSRRDPLIGQYII